MHVELGGMNPPGSSQGSRHTFILNVPAKAQVLKVWLLASDILSGVSGDFQGLGLAEGG